MAGQCRFRRSSGRPGQQAMPARKASWPGAAAAGRDWVRPCRRGFGFSLLLVLWAGLAAAPALAQETPPPAETAPGAENEPAPGAENEPAPGAENQPAPEVESQPAPEESQPALGIGNGAENGLGYGPGLGALPEAERAQTS